MEAIEKNVTINAPLSRVWKALTDPVEIEKWMLMSTTFAPETGRDFTFQAEASEEWDGVFNCTLKECIENKKLIYTWNTAFINADTLVEIELTENGDKTELTLTHSGWEKIAENQEKTRSDHNTGWDLRFVQNIKEIVEGTKQN